MRMAGLPISSLYEKVIESENLEVSYDQRELLAEIATSINNLYSVQKPYDYRYTYKHSVTIAHSYERYVFDYPIYQIVVMPVPARIELFLDTDSVPYILEENESLNITTQAEIMAITNTANPAITEEVRIYVFGRKS
jgi:hypothetical protein